jgi:dTDP-glucose pyrophosphorylase
MRYGVVPAGGLGTRSGLPHAKELARVGGKPVIEYILDRLRTARMDKIFITVAPDKKDLISYLETNSPHRQYIDIVVGERKGLIAGIVGPANNLHEEDELYFGFPDTVWYPETGFQSLITNVQDIVLGLLPSQTPQLFGSVIINNNTITAIQEKPQKPQSSWIYGFGRIKVKAIPKLIELAAEYTIFTELLDAFNKQNPIGYALFPEGVYMDTGTPAGLKMAQDYVSKLL